MDNLTSLEEIQFLYLKIIEKNFGSHFSLMNKNNISADEYINYILSDKKAINSIAEKAQDFLESIVEFWEKYSKILFTHINSLSNIFKGTFGGEPFPSGKINIVSKCGIYIDTLILPDPYIRSFVNITNANNKEQAYMLLKYALNILEFKNIINNKGKIPIVVIAPDLGRIQYLNLDRDNIIENTIINYYNILFDQSFTSIKEAGSYCYKIDNNIKFNNQIYNKDSLFFDFNNNTAFNNNYNYGQNIFHTINNQISKCFEIIEKSKFYLSTPIIESPTTWQCLKWILKSENSINTIDLQSLHIIDGIKKLSNTNYNIIGNIPIDSLISIREHGAINEFREILSKGIDEICAIDPNDFMQTSDKVFKNIQRAYFRHNNEIDKLKNKKWKFAGRTISSFLIYGIFAIVIAKNSSIPNLLSIPASILIKQPNVKETLKEYSKLKNSSKTLNTSAIGLLF